MNNNTTRNLILLIIFKYKSRDRSGILTYPILN